MSRVSGASGYSSSRWRSASGPRRSDRAIEEVTASHQTEVILAAHRDTDALRQFGERFRKKKGFNGQSRAEFELDKDSGQIFVNLFDEETGHLQMKLTPEEVAEALKSLEETDDNESALSSFFVDITV